MKLTLGKWSMNWEHLLEGRGNRSEHILKITSTTRRYSLAYVKPKQNKEHSSNPTNHRIQFRIRGSAGKVCIPKHTHLSHKVKLFNHLTAKGNIQLRCFWDLLVCFVIITLIIRRRKKCTWWIQINHRNDCYPYCWWNGGVNDLEIHSCVGGLIDWELWLQFLENVLEVEPTCHMSLWFHYVVFYGPLSVNILNDKKNHQIYCEPLLARNFELET